MAREEEASQHSHNLGGQLHSGMQHNHSHMPNGNQEYDIEEEDEDYDDDEEDYEDDEDEEPVWPGNTLFKFEKYCWFTYAYLGVLMADMFCVWLRCLGVNRIL